MVKFYTLVSGSSGNSTFVSDGRTSVLIDCGINGKTAEKHLNEIGEDAKNISAILITHEHSDHISGAGVFSRRFDVPVYATKKTWNAILTGSCSIGKMSEKNIKFIEKDSDFEIGSLGFLAFSTPHDSADSVGYNIFAEHGRRKLSVATDMGKVDKSVVEYLLGSESILLESNHDVAMLLNGSYPYYLKQRILGDRGHLSNESCAKISACLAKNGTRKITLGHLSSENNSPDAAYNASKLAIEQSGGTVGGDIFLSVAERYFPTSLF